MPPKINDLQRFGCGKGCSNHLDLFPPRPGSGWTDDDLQSLACTRTVLSDPLLNKILALLDVQQVGIEIQLQKHVRDTTLIKRLGEGLLPFQVKNRLAIPERKFVLIPWRPDQKAAGISRLLLLAICFPGFLTGKDSLVCLVYDILAKPNVKSEPWPEGCDQAVQHACSLVAHSYNIQNPGQKKYEVCRAVLAPPTGGDDASIPHLGVINTVQRILESRGAQLRVDFRAEPPSLRTPYDVRKAVLGLIGNHYGSVPPSTPAKDACEKNNRGGLSTSQSEGRLATSEPSPTRAWKKGGAAAPRADGEQGGWASNDEDELSLVGAHALMGTRNGSTRARAASRSSLPPRQPRSLEDGGNGHSKGGSRPATGNNGAGSNGAGNHGSNITTGPEQRSLTVDLQCCKAVTMSSPAGTENSGAPTERSTPLTTPDGSLAKGGATSPAEASRSRPSEPRAMQPANAAIVPALKRAAEGPDEGESATQRRRLEVAGAQERSPISVLLDRVLSEAVGIGPQVEALREAEKSAEQGLRRVVDGMKTHIETNVFSCGGLVNAEFLVLEKEREREAVNLKRITEDKRFAEGEQERVQLLCREFLKRFD